MKFDVDPSQRTDRFFLGLFKEMTRQNLAEATISMNIELHSGTTVDVKFSLTLSTVTAEPVVVEGHDIDTIVSRVMEP